MSETRRNTPLIVTGCQIRAARALLGWTRSDLAHAAGLHANSIAYWEEMDVISGRRPPHACTRMREALHRAGVEFVGLHEVQLRKLTESDLAWWRGGEEACKGGVQVIDGMIDS